MKTKSIYRIEIEYSDHRHEWPVFITLFKFNKKIGNRGGKRLSGVLGQMASIIDAEEEEKSA